MIDTLTPEEMRRLVRIGERICEPHKSAKRCFKLGKADRMGFQASCMRPAGHAGDCDPHARMPSDEADVRFLFSLVQRRILGKP